ncbi:three-Cys-motif partner protein TcmP [Sulfitobacter sp. R86518]|uniref:three-Cys-motif partner protein TcmP n=1 Tax=Sulfitobacter sp. R86518 TaxID=3093858 RepID=UPI0036DF6EC7
MVKKQYDWESGPKLDLHTARKHKVVREYFAEYLRVRCGLPQQERFRVAVVDGFAGGGRYLDGGAGSPIIFIEELIKASNKLNIDRAVSGMKPIELECLLILNDAQPDVVTVLEEAVAATITNLRETAPKLTLRVEFRCKKFEELYPEVEEILRIVKFKNVLFNLDQCGTRHIEIDTLKRIMRLNGSVEIFYTFMIDSLLAYLKRTNPAGLVKQLGSYGVEPAQVSTLDGFMNCETWLGRAEMLVYNVFKDVAQFHSPFSINNPEGWRYWLVHFSKNYRARQVYNQVLHDNASSQAHFGRSGLNMMSYNPDDEGSPYFFDTAAREGALRALYDDIPDWIKSSGDAMLVEDFYQSAYNDTPAHANDINEAIMINPDIQVITPNGGFRRSANSIQVGDTLRLANQRSFHIFGNFGANRNI